MEGAAIVTTIVGSYPQPAWLIDRDRLGDRLPPRVRARELCGCPEPFLEEAQDDATRLAVEDMERAGDEADWMFCLVRTEPDAPRHRGISYLLIEARTPGIDVRPLRVMTGEVHFNEVFFDDVRVPAENLVGARGQGWR